MRNVLCSCILLSLGLLAPSTAAMHQAKHPTLGQFCRKGYIEGRVIDPFDRPVGDAHVELLVTSRGGKQPVLLHSTQTDADGRFTIPCPSLEVFELQVTSRGYNRLNLAEGDQVALADELVIQLVPPCIDVITPTTPLTSADLSAVYSLLAKIAFTNRSWTVLCTENLEDVKGTLNLPPNVRLLSMREIRKISRKSTVYYVVMSRINTENGCVKIGYFSTCMERGQGCVLCCESQELYFYRATGGWKSEWLGGAVY